MKKILLLLATLIAMIALLASCGGGEGENNDGELTPPYDQIIVENGGLVYTKLQSAFTSATGRIVNIINHTAPEAEREVAIGNTNRAITAEARAVLEEIDEIDFEWDTAAYIVYASGGDVAIYWTHEHTAQSAIDIFTEEYIQKGKLTFEDGIVTYGHYSFVEAKEKEEAEFRKGQLATIEANFGKEVREAVEDFLVLADDDFYIWLANLYDPGKYDEEGNPLGGGFYYANSARDTDGFLPDIESTRQAMTVISASGMIKKYDNDFTKAFPEKMQKEIIAFAQSLQSTEDGYFYHPQWGTSVSVGRYSRDMNNSITVLKNLGTQPLYNTPTGTKGIYGDPPGLAAAAALTERLSSSDAVAVSKVIAAASVVWSDQLKTLDAFKEYLNGFEATIGTKSYSIGHNVSSQAGQIKSREKQAIKAGELVDADGDGVAEDGYIKAFESFFDSHQLDNGLWEVGTVAEDTITYTAVNGLMKISSGYSSLGIQLKKIDAALESAMHIALKVGADHTGDTPKNSVDVYNPWVSINNVLGNAKEYGDEGEHAAMRALLKEKAVELIRITTDKISKFEKADGSFGYSIGTNMPTSQGCAAAVPGFDEGDVNGGSIALRSTSANMFSALGISIQLYFDSDFDRFIHIASGLEHVEKTVKIEPNPPVDFEDYSVGESYFTEFTSAMNSGYLEVAKDPDVSGTHGKVLKFVAEKVDLGDSITMPVGGSTLNASCFEFSFDMFVTDYVGKNTTVFRMTMSNCFRLTVKYKDGKLILGDNSNQGVSEDYNVKLDLGKWYNIRAEYYVGDKDGVRIKIYVDDTLVKVSTNYYGNTGDGTSSPKSSTKTLQIYSYYPVIHTTYFDNIEANRTDRKYVNEEPSLEPEVKPDAPAIANGDFESLTVGQTEIPGMTLSVNSGEPGNRVAIDVDPTNPNNKVLAVETNPNAGSGVNNQIRFKASDTDGNCYVLDTDIYIAEELSGKTNIQFSVCSNAAGNIFSTNCYIKPYGISKLTTREADGSSPTVATDIKTSGWFNLRMEYYSAEHILKVFVDGKFICEKETYNTEKGKDEKLGYVKIQPVFASDVLVYFDNLTVEAIDKEYVAGDTSAK